MFASELCTLKWCNVSPSLGAGAVARTHVWSAVVQGKQKAPDVATLDNACCALCSRPDA